MVGLFLLPAHWLPYPQLPASSSTFRAGGWPTTKAHPIFTLLSRLGFPFHGSALHLVHETLTRNTLNMSNVICDLLISPNSWASPPIMRILKSKQKNLKLCGKGKKQIETQWFSDMPRPRMTQEVSLGMWNPDSSLLASLSSCTDLIQPWASWQAWENGSTFHFSIFHLGHLCNFTPIYITNHQILEKIEVGGLHNSHTPTQVHQEGKMFPWCWIH